MGIQVSAICLPVDFVIALRHAEVYRFTAYITLVYAVLGGWRGFLSEPELEVPVLRVFAHLLSPPSWVQVRLVVRKLQGKVLRLLL